MELCDPSLIEKLIMQEQPRVSSGFKPLRTNRRVAAPGCRCGQCLRCRDNARWERIYREKFADPNYYASRPVRQGSSLDALVP